MQVYSNTVYSVVVCSEQCGVCSIECIQCMIPICIREHTVVVPEGGMTSQYTVHCTILYSTALNCGVQCSVTSQYIAALSILIHSL